MAAAAAAATPRSRLAGQALLDLEAQASAAAEAAARRAQAAADRLTTTRSAPSKPSGYRPLWAGLQPQQPPWTPAGTTWMAGRASAATRSPAGAPQPPSPLPPPPSPPPPPPPLAVERAAAADAPDPQKRLPFTAATTAAAEAADGEASGPAAAAAAAELDRLRAEKIEAEAALSAEREAREEEAKVLREMQVAPKAATTSLPCCCHAVASCRRLPTSLTTARACPRLQSRVRKLGSLKKAMASEMKGLE